MSNFRMEDYYSFVEDVAPFMDDKILHGAKNVELGQWELPFEAILIALTKHKRDEITLDFSHVEALAEEAAITNDEGLLDPRSWSNFQNWERDH